MQKGFLDNERPSLLDLGKGRFFMAIFALAVFYADRSQVLMCPRLFQPVLCECLYEELSQELNEDIFTRTYVILKVLDITIDLFASKCEEQRI